MNSVKSFVVLLYTVIVLAFPLWVRVGDFTIVPENVAIEGAFLLVWLSWGVSAVLLVFCRSRTSQLIGVGLSAAQLAMGLTAAFAEVFLTDGHLEEGNLMEGIPLILCVVVPFAAGLVFLRSAVQLGAQRDLPASGRPAR
jgi:hypothetical protein